MDQDNDGVFGEPIDDVFSGTITFASPDLVVGDAAAPTEVQNGEAITIEWTVTNFGGAAAAMPWTDRIVLSPNDIYGDADDVFLGTVTRSTDLANDASYTETLDLSVPFGVSGDYYVFIRTDYTNAVFEEDDLNNTASRAITIAEADPPADLIVDAITIPSLAYRGESFDLTWRVRNDRYRSNDCRPLDGPCLPQ